MSGKRRGRGEGSIEELPSGKWRAVLSVGFKSDGTRDKRGHTADTKKEALAWLRKQQSLMNVGQLPKASKLTVGAWLAQWLSLKKPSVSPRTYEQYEEHVRLHLSPVIGHFGLAKLEPQHVADLLARSTSSAAMKAKVTTTLRMALKAAIPEHLTTNPATAIPKPRSDPPEMIVWNAQQIKQFLAAARGDRLEALYVLALDSGMRQGELFALQWHDMAGNIITVARSLEEDKQGSLRLKPPKSKAGRRRIALASSTVTVIEAHRQRMEAEGRGVEGDASIFVDTAGGWLRKTNLPFQALVKRAGVPRLRFHDLRHTSATQLLLHGINVKAVSARLGHRSIRVTLDVYSHVMPEMHDQVTTVMEGLLRLSHGSPTDGQIDPDNETKKAS